MTKSSRLPMSNSTPRPFHAPSFAAWTAAITSSTTTSRKSPATFAGLADPSVRHVRQPLGGVRMHPSHLVHFLCVGAAFDGHRGALRAVYDVNRTVVQLDANGD